MKVEIRRTAELVMRGMDVRPNLSRAAYYDIQWVCLDDVLSLIREIKEASLRGEDNALTLLEDAFSEELKKWYYHH